MKEQWAKELYVRGEKAADYADIVEINRLAFAREDEAKLVEDIRKTKNYEFGFSLVAIKEDKILGHALFSKAFVVHKGRRFKCLALGPIAVLPEHQRKGIGKALIAEGFERAKEVGFGAVVVIGDPAYYEQFGFKQSAVYKVRCSFNKNPENFMVKEISRNALRGIIGTVQYAREFLTLAAADEKRAEEKAKEEAKFEEGLHQPAAEQPENVETIKETASTNIHDTVDAEKVTELNEQVSPINEQETKTPEITETEEKTEDPGKNTGEIESLI
ncbi:MAG: N-acetyltransferase [Ignavibacteria bacterium]